jgi:hypothetical protein
MLSSTPFLDGSVQLIQRVSTKMILNGSTYTSRNQGHHWDRHLADYSSVCVFVHWELPPEAMCKGGPPSSKVQVMDDGDDTHITIWPRPHGEKVQWIIVLKES